MIIIYETEIPIPIPLFYDELGVFYNGIEGMEGALALTFPQPEFSIIEAITLAESLISFFTDSSYYFNTAYTDDDVDDKQPDGSPMTNNKLPEKMNIKFQVKPAYIQTPELLGSHVIGFKEGLPEFDLNRLIAVLLNTIKSGSINYLIKSLPFKYRWFNLGASAPVLDGLNAALQFAVTTPGEFAKRVYPNLILPESDETQDILALMPSSNMLDQNELAHVEDTGLKDKDQGLIVLLNGLLNFGNHVDFNILFALAATDLTGFGSAIRIKGEAAGIFDIELFGLFAIQPQAKEKFIIKGKNRLYIRKLIHTEGEFHVSNRRLYVSSKLDLFHGIPNIDLAGYIDGEITDTGIHLEGGCALQLYDFTFSSNAGFSVGTFDNKEVNEAFFSLEILTTKFEFRGAQKGDALSFNASCSPINLCKGLLVIANTTDKTRGPLACIEIDTHKNQLKHFELDGSIRFLGILSTDARINLTDKGFEFDTTSVTNLLNDGIYSCTNLSCILNPYSCLEGSGQYTMYLDIGRIIKNIIKEVTKIIDLPYVPIPIAFLTDASVSLYDRRDKRALTDERKILEQEREEKHRDYEQSKSAYDHAVARIEKELKEERDKVMAQVEAINKNTKEILDEITQCEEEKTERLDHVNQIHDQLVTLKDDDSPQQLNRSLKSFRQKVEAKNIETDTIQEKLSTYKNENKVDDLVDNLNKYNKELYKIGKDNDELQNKVNKLYEDILIQKEEVINNVDVFSKTITVLESQKEYQTANNLKYELTFLEDQNDDLNRCMVKLRKYIDQSSIDQSLVERLNELNNHADMKAMELSGLLSDEYIDFLSGKLYEKMGESYKLYQKSLHCDRPLYHHIEIPDTRYTPEFTFTVKVVFRLFDENFTLSDIRFVIPDVYSAGKFDLEIMNKIPGLILDELSQNLKNMLYEFANSFTKLVNLLYRLVTGDVTVCKIPRADACIQYRLDHGDNSLREAIDAYNRQVGKTQHASNLNIMHIYKHEFDLAAEEAAKIMYKAGETLEDIEKGLGMAYNKTTHEIKQIIKALF